MSDIWGAYFWDGLLLLLLLLIFDVDSSVGDHASLL